MLFLAARTVPKTDNAHTNTLGMWPKVRVHQGIFCIEMADAFPPTCPLARFQAASIIHSEDVVVIRTFASLFCVSCADEEVQDAVVPQLPPKICFNLLKEKDARKKLQDLGLSAVGEKNVRMPLPEVDIARWQERAPS